MIQYLVDYASLFFYELNFLLLWSVFQVEKAESMLIGLI